MPIILRVLSLMLLLPAVSPGLQAALVSLPQLEIVKGPTQAQTRQNTLVLYLRERLAECAGVQPVEAARDRYIREKLFGGAIELPASAQLDAYRGYLAIEALIRCYADGDSFTVDIRTVKGDKELTLAAGQAVDTRALVRRCAVELAELLALSAADRAVLLEDRVPDPEAFATVYRNQAIWVYSKYNTGEHRLKPLRPLLPSRSPHARQKPNPAVAALALHNIGLLVQDASSDGARLSPANALAYASLLLPDALGTRAEAELEALVRLRPDSFADELVALAKPLARENDMLELDDIEALGMENDGATIPHTRLETDTPRPTRLAALRMLGAVAPSEAAREVLVQTATNEDAEVRLAAVKGLTAFPRESTAQVLRRLAGDHDPRVALTAGYALWRHDEAPDGLVPLARKSLGTPGLQGIAAEILAAQGTPDEVARILADLTAQPLAQRERIVARLLPRDALDATARLRLLGDHAPAIVLLAIEALDVAELAEAEESKLRSLARDPHPSLASAARLALAPRRPDDPPGQRQFDLTFAHPYRRQQILEHLAPERSAEATRQLREAAANPDPQTRTRALQILVERDDEQAPEFLRSGIADPHLWVRLHAAVLLSQRADRADTAALEQALSMTREPGTRSYLEAALARARGEPLPESGPAAHSVAGDRVLTWSCGLGRYAETSPIQAYYLFTTEVNDTWRRCHEQGKIFFSRINIEGHPGRVAVSRAARDSFWLRANEALTPDRLPYIDGVVLGEETMSMEPDALWDDGWALFCHDAAISVERVQGSLDNLTPGERRAWTHWALARSVEGFNTMARYLRLRCGRLRPGLQIATFLPEETLVHTPPAPNPLAWDFDVAGLYDYKCTNRMAAYNMTRRYQTLWPDRPIIWLSLGFGGYEMRPLDYRREMPETPLFTRRRRAYADTVTAWLAGADAGWFSPMMVVTPDFNPRVDSLHGTQVGIEDIAPDSPIVDAAVTTAFRDIAKVLELERVGKPELDGDFEHEVEIDDTLQLVDGKAAAAAALAEEIEGRKTRFRRGLLFYQMYLYDCARVFNELKRVRTRPSVLAIRAGVSSWTNPPHRRAVVPGMALPTHYDFLCDINIFPQLQEERYRMILVDDEGPLRDATIAGLSAWLRRDSHLLYIHGRLATEDDAEAGTPEDHDGVLGNDWPWEEDVKAVRRAPATRKPPAPAALTLSRPDRSLVKVSAVAEYGYEVSDQAEVLASLEGTPVLVLWRAPDGRGAVLFDGLTCAGSAYHRLLQGELNRLHQENGLGVALPGPHLHVRLQVGNVVGDSAAHRYGDACEPATLPGLDLLTGTANPRSDQHTPAALATTEFSGQHVAVAHGVSLLASQPFARLEKTANGLIVEGAGLVRATALNGAPLLLPATGKPLAVPADPMRWLLHESSPGQIRVDGEKGMAVLYFRSASAVEVRAP